MISGGSEGFANRRRQWFQGVKPGPPSRHGETTLRPRLRLRRHQLKADRPQGGAHQEELFTNPISAKPLSINCTAIAVSSSPISRVRMRIPVSPKYPRTRSAAARI